MNQDFSLNEEIEQTAFAGEVRSRLTHIERDIGEVRVDVRWLRDNVRPIVIVVGGIPTVIAVLSMVRSYGLL